MRIAVVSPYALDLPGGVQTQVLEIAAGLRSRGHDAWAVGPAVRTNNEQFTSIGRYVRIPANQSVAPVALGPSVMRRTLRALAGADVVHIHEPFMPLTSWAALRADARLVVTFHADPTRLMRTIYRGMAPLTERVLRRAHAVTAVSPIAASAVVGRRPLVIPNGITLPKLSAHRAAAQVVFVGRDEPRKGLDILLAAWPAVHERVPESRLIVMGAPRSEVPAGVTALGPVAAATKWDVLCSSAVFCAPNLGGESFGITLLEGMAAGCAAVASDLPAFTHLLGGSGVQLPAGDPIGLADTLIDVLTDRSRVTELGRQARLRAEDFSWTRVLTAYEATYNGHPNSL